jgi:hypothetical protein
MSHNWLKSRLVPLITPRHGPHRKHHSSVQLLLVMNLLPSSGRCLYSHYLATCLHATISSFVMLAAILWHLSIQGTYLKQNLRFLWRWLWGLLSSGMCPLETRYDVSSDSVRRAVSFRRDGLARVRFLILIYLCCVTSSIRSSSPNLLRFCIAAYNICYLWYVSEVSGNIFYNIC